jgi:hypothetical protein
MLQALGALQHWGTEAQQVAPPPLPDSSPPLPGELYRRSKPGHSLTDLCPVPSRACTYCVYVCVLVCFLAGGSRQQFSCHFGVVDLPASGGAASSLSPELELVVPDVRISSAEGLTGLAPFTSLLLPLLCVAQMRVGGQKRMKMMPLGRRRCRRTRRRGTRTLWMVRRARRPPCRLQRATAAGGTGRPSSCPRATALPACSSTPRSSSSSSSSSR